MTSKELFDKCSEILDGHYTTTMVPIARQAKASGFFPGASGFFYTGDLMMPVQARFMFVAQDFGTEKYQRELQDGSMEDVESGTGKMFGDLLKEAGINVTDCFFTNALFGACNPNAGNHVGDGEKKGPYRDSCLSALRLQIKKVQPQVIVFLGKVGAEILSDDFSEIRRWGVTKFETIYENNQEVIQVSGHSTVKMMAILVHPSGRNWKLHRSDLCGHSAQIALLKNLGQKAVVA